MKIAKGKVGKIIEQEVKSHFPKAGNHNLATV
jgi:hypothetical protein